MSYVHRFYICVSSYYTGADYESFRFNETKELVSIGRSILGFPVPVPVPIGQSVTSEDSQKVGPPGQDQNFSEQDIENLESDI